MTKSENLPPSSILFGVHKFFTVSQKDLFTFLHYTPSRDYKECNTLLSEFNVMHVIQSAQATFRSSLQ